MACADTNSTMRTRNQDRVWLVGHPIGCITGSRLPSNQQVLALFFYHHKILKKTVRESATTVAREIQVLWDKARIPTTQERNVIPRIVRLFESWKNLQKRSKARTETQIQKEHTFIELLESLFDIAHLNALEMITIEDDRQFLIAQRTGRRGYMAGVDRNLSALEERRALRKQRIAERHKREAERHENASLPIDQLSSRSEDETCDAGVSSDDAMDQNMGTSSEHHTRPVNIVTPQLASALDRTQVSDRKAAFVIAATAKSLGLNVTDLAVNRSSIRRSRISHRSQLADEVKNAFECDHQTPLVIHWDGKLLPDITGKPGTVERLPIYISGGGTDKLLCVPKLDDGCGKTIAKAVQQAIDDWELTNRIKAACFDTTASNTGIHSGACHFLEQFLNKSLLYLPCRHHIMEIIIGHVFDTSFGSSSGPDIKLFVRFRSSWSLIDVNKFETGYDDEETSYTLSKFQSSVDKVVNFIRMTLQTNLPRDDYKELLELVLLFLGDKPDRGVRFIQPGAHHRARWMGKIIYSLKIWMFRKQFSVTARELKGLQDVNIFAALVYVKAWFTATNAVSAPVNDLQLLQTMQEYKAIQNAVADAAIKKFRNHLWYLSEVSVGLSFFADDDIVPLKTKRELVAQLTKPPRCEIPVKRAEMQLKDITQSKLSDFVTIHTKQFFTTFNISQDFLEKDPDEWTSNLAYREAKDMLSKLRVVNDLAERGVALIGQYNNLLTKDEEQKQFLLQVVEEHRHRFPDSTKTCLVAELDN